MYEFKIDEERCIQCGLCAQDCIAGVIEMKEYPVLEQEGCMKCEHCLTVCPTGALSILGKNPDDSTELKGNMPSAEQMETLIKGRRSIRKYKDENLDADVVKKLVEVAWNAPTGVNQQSVLVTVISDKEIMDSFRKDAYAELTESLEAGTLTGEPILEYLAWATGVHNETGEDVIFRNAPHLVITSAPKDGACPEADTHIYLSYFELLAQSMGIGTVWNGMIKGTVDVALPHLRKRLGIPDNHKIGYAMSFGKPAIKFQRTVERGPALVNVVGK